MTYTFSNRKAEETGKKEHLGPSMLRGKQALQGGHRAPWGRVTAGPEETETQAIAVRK